MGGELSGGGARTLNWRLLQRLLGELADKIRVSGFKPDIVVGLGKRGWVFARLLSDRLGVSDLITLHADSAIDVGRILPFKLRDRRILIALDVEEAAEALEGILKNLGDSGVSEVRTATLLLPRTSKVTVDYHHSMGESAIYPWELHRHRGV